MSNFKTYPMPDVQKIADKIKSEGGPQLDVTKPSGQETAPSAFGDITLGWNINDGYCTITVIKKPWDVPYGTIWSHTDALFE